MITVGDNVKKFRSAAGLTQQALAEKSGLSINFVSRLEWSDNQNVSLKNLSKISNALNVSLADLVSDISGKRTDKDIERLSYMLYNLDQEKSDALCTAFIQIIKSI